MMLRCTLLAVAASGIVTSHAAAATRLPGLQPTELGRLVIARSDIRQLNAAVTLEAGELMLVHEAMKRYQLAVENGSRELIAAMTAMEPADAVAASRREQERTLMVEQVRDRIESRRRNGEFRDNPGGLREAWQEAMDEAERELQLARRDAAEVDGWGKAFREQAQVLAEWYESKSALDAALRAELMTYAGESQEAELNRWWQEAKLDHAMKRGRLSGERHDPFGVAFERSDATDLVREVWQGEHAELIDDRDMALRRIPLLAADAIARGSIHPYRNAVAEAMSAREAVREHAIEGFEAVALLLDDAAASSYLRASQKRAFPGIWQVDRALRALNAASQLSTLDEAQRGMLAALRLEHLQPCEELRRRHLDAVRAEEGRQLADQDVQRALVFLRGAEFTPRGTPMLDASASQRRTLCEDTMARLRGILTDAQWQRIPGTRTEPARDQTPPS